MNNLLIALRNLKLDGMKTSLEALRDAGEIQLPSLVQLLTRLTEAEAEQRKIAKSLSLEKRAKFRYCAGLQSIKTGIERNLDRALITRLADGRWISQGKNLLITGPTGAGKSFLASALGKQACLLGYSTLYFNCNRLWAQLRQARSKGSYEKELRAMAKAELLVLDDFGLMKLEVADRLSFLELLEDRWGKTSTVVVSQRPFATWHELLGEPTIADAICDRLFSNAEKIELKGESMRINPPNP
jgi:DNA replication protein DnaC